MFSQITVVSNMPPAIFPVLTCCNPVVSLRPVAPEVCWYARSCLSKGQEAFRRCVLPDMLVGRPPRDTGCLACRP